MTDKGFMSSEILHNGIWMTPEAYRRRMRWEIFKEGAFCIGFVVLIGVAMVAVMWAF